MADLIGKKILVADDNKMIRKQLSGMLAKYGAQVILAKDGQECYELAVEETPDLILMDVRMPLMDGYEATLKIKDADLEPDIPVIMLTGMKDREGIEMGKRCGVAMYLTKPVPGAQILAAILSLL